MEWEFRTSYNVTFLFHKCGQPTIFTARNDNPLVRDLLPLHCTDCNINIPEDIHTQIMLLNSEYTKYVDI